MSFLPRLVEDRRDVHMPDYRADLCRWLKQICSVNVVHRSRFDTRFSAMCGVHAPLSIVVLSTLRPEEKWIEHVYLLLIKRSRRGLRSQRHPAKDRHAVS